MSPQKASPLTAIAGCAAMLSDQHLPEAAAVVDEARAAVAELVEAADRLQKSMPPSLVKQSTKNPNAGFIDWRDWIPLYAEVGELRQAIARVQGGEA